MAQRNQYNLQGQSIDSTIADSPSRPGPSGWRGKVNVNDDSSEGAAILPDVERSASPSTLTWPSESPENPFDTAQSADFAAPQRAESTITSSESDSLSRSHDTPGSLSNQSGQFRGSYVHKPSLEILQEDFPTLTDRQDTIPSDLPRLPTLQELRALPVTTHLIPPRSKESVKNIIIVLHDHSGDEKVLQDFAEQNLHPKNTACLLLRGVSAIPGKKDSYQWEENNDDFFKSSKIILENLIMDLLKSKCNIPERKVIIFGQGEGAAVALTTFSTWKRVEFGGVVCVGGYLPPYAAPSGDTKSKTAVLLLGGELGTTNPVAKNRIEQTFSYVDCDLLPGKDDALPRSNQQLKSLKSFFCHRLHEEEWTKPAVITFGKPTCTLRGPTDID
jgi:predicted esterase